MHPQLRLIIQADMRLRGQQLEQIAIAVLVESRADAEAIHYREWFEMLRVRGHLVAGKEPIDTFLATDQPLHGGRAGWSAHRGCDRLRRCCVIGWVRVSQDPRGRQRRCHAARPFRPSANQANVRPVSDEESDLDRLGYSNHSFEEFIGLLAGERIEFVVDVRSFPASRIAPQFNRAGARGALMDEGLRYLYLGEQLGGRPTRDEHYDHEGHADDLMAAEPDFLRALERLVVGSAASHRIALLCSEGQPAHCHRRLAGWQGPCRSGVVLRHLPGSLLRGQAVTLRVSDDQAALFAPYGATRWRLHNRFHTDVG